MYTIFIMVQYRRKKMNMKASVRNEVSRALAQKIEVKSIVETNSGSVSTTGVLKYLLTIAPGTAHDQRLGNKLNLLSFYLRIMWANGDRGYNNVRTSLVQTRKPITQISNLFDTTSFASFGSVFASWDYDTVSRVILDKNTTINQLVANEKRSVFFKKYMKCPDDIFYDTSVDTSTQSNYYLLICSDSLIAPHPNMNYVLRTRYTDC